MPSVVFWPGVGGGTEWYRCRTPGGALQRRGWDVSYVGDDTSRIAADVVVLQRVFRPGLPELIGKLRALGCFVVYDIDDWYDKIPRYNPASQGVNRHTVELLHESMRAADLISVSTDDLADGYRRLNRTAVLPNYLDPAVWPAQPLRERHDKIRVGWLGAFRYRAPDVAVLKSWVKPWLRTRPDVVFAAIGCPELLDYLDIPGLHTESDVWPYERLPEMVAHLDIGLVPLAHNRFNESKSWCKGLEYAAGGVPCVASPSREYRKYIRPGVNGQLGVAGRWSEQVDTIIDNLPRYRLGALSTAREYMVDDHIDEWLTAWQTVEVNV